MPGLPTSSGPPGQYGAAPGVPLVAKRGVVDAALAAELGFGGKRTTAPTAASSVPAPLATHLPPADECAALPPSRAQASSLLPDALLRAALLYLTAEGLADAQGVCRRWLAVAGDDALWGRLCRASVSRTHPDPYRAGQGPPGGLTGAPGSTGRAVAVVLPVASPAPPFPQPSALEAALQASLWEDAARSRHRPIPGPGGEGEGVGGADPLPALLPELQRLRLDLAARHRSWREEEGGGQDAAALAAAAADRARVEAGEAARARAVRVRTALVAGVKRVVEAGGGGALDTRTLPVRGVPCPLPWRLAWRALPALRTEGIYALRQEYIRRGVRDMFHPNSSPDGVLRVVYHRTFSFRADGLCLYALMPGEAGEAVKEFRRLLRTCVPRGSHPALARLALVGGDGLGQGGVDVMSAALAILHWEDTLGAGSGSGPAPRPRDALSSLGPAFASLLSPSPSEPSPSPSALGVGLWSQEGASVRVAVRALGSRPAVATRWAFALTSSDTRVAVAAWDMCSEATRAAVGEGEALGEQDGEEGEGWVWRGPGYGDALALPLFRDSFLPGLPGRHAHSYNDILLVRPEGVGVRLLHDPKSMWGAGGPCTLPGPLSALPYDCTTALVGRRGGGDSVPVPGLGGQAFTWRPTQGM